MKKALIVLIVFFIHFQSFSQQDRKVVEDPAFLQLIQGTWVHVINGDFTWQKVVISGNTVQHYIAQPRDGKFSLNYTIKIATTVKVTDRNNYDGKLTTESVALIDAGNEKLNYELIHSKVIEGKRYITLGDLSGYKYVQVPSNYSPWD